MIRELVTIRIIPSEEGLPQQDAGPVQTLGGWGR